MDNGNNNMYSSSPKYINNDSNNNNNNIYNNSPSTPGSHNSYNYNNMYNNIMYNSDVDSGSNHYHDILINNNKNLKTKRRFKYKVLSFIIAIFFIISICSFVFIVYFSAEQLAFKGFKFIETKCHLNSTKYTSRNETSGDCQILNENEWWYEYDKSFYKYGGNSQFNYTSSSDSDNVENNILENISNSNSNSNSNNNNNKYNKHDNIICYQGIYNVYFNDTENQLLNGDIYGIWTPDLSRVDSYLHQVKSDKDQTCFYNKHDVKEIIWLRPPSSFFNILLIVILGIVSLFSFIVFIIICRKAFGPLSKEEEKAKLLSNSSYYRYTSDNVYSLENSQ